ncbi:MAG: xanthine dehydrogenase family protein molybdopterin-binding subunit [Betaproteobacteria bacterium]|nr:xanthine dehydrogenase family protein molybdopterin-binding subunit [Betaproteobacteria bacterium]
MSASRSSCAPESLARREFMQAGGALVIGFSMQGAIATPSAGAPGKPAGFKPNAWLRIDTDGSVEFLISKTEMGQGTESGMAMVLCEELDADWARVSVRTIQPDGKRFMITGGSYSIAGAWVVGRRAAAAARHMLLEAGASALGVPRAECRTGNHAVSHPASGRQLGYGELVAAAAKLSVPKEPALKDPATFKLVGKAMPAKNLDALVRAESRYGMDIQVPGMLYAVIERSPVVNGRIAHVDDAAARQVAGVSRVVRLRGNTFPTYNYVRDGVAVVANSTWAALKGRRALKVSWHESWTDGAPRNGALASSTRLATDFQRLLTDPAVKTENGLHPDVVAVRDGTVEGMNAAFQSAARTLDMFYDVPLQAHVPMEPMNATAHCTDERCEVWVPCHFQTRLFNALRELTGLPPERIIIHTTMLGGSFGRRLDVDYAIEAVMLSRELAKPVQVVWTREDDVRCGLYSPPSRHRVRVALDAGGNPLAMDHAFAALSVWKQQEPTEIEPSGLDYAAAFDAIKFPYRVPQRVVRHRLVEQTIRVFWWRRGYTPNHTFVNECLLDECAHAAGVDPLDYRLRLLPENQPVKFANKGGEVEEIHTGRLARVLRAAADAANWRTPLPKGRGRGIAATVTDTHVAQVVEVEVTDGRIRVTRVVTAVDCGIVINPQLVKAQVEGSVVFGLTAALKGAITVENGRVQQSNFHDYPLLAIDEMPIIETVLLPSTVAPSGTGEQISHPVAAALANAIFAATGQRLRGTPFRLA